MNSRNSFGLVLIRSGLYHLNIRLLFLLTPLAAGVTNVYLTKSLKADPKIR
jgi:hypothetical protein